MSLREEWISSRLKSLLRRRTAPKSIHDKPELQREEISSLLRAIMRYAPKENYQEWWEAFSDRLLEESSTYSWPHPGDVKKAGASLKQPNQGRRLDQLDMDAHKINADRIRAGESVGDEWVYGRRCAEMLARGLLGEHELAPYRSGLFFRLRDVYGESIAVDRERAFKDRHEAGVQMVREIGSEQKRDVPRHTALPRPDAEEIQ